MGRVFGGQLDHIKNIYIRALEGQVGEVHACSRRWLASMFLFFQRPGRSKKIILIRFLLPGSLYLDKIELFQQLKEEVLLLLSLIVSMIEGYSFKLADSVLAPYSLRRIFKLVL